MNREGAAVVVGAFFVAVVVTVVQPFTRGDVDAGAYVAALQTHRALVQPGDLVLVHPPWRDDVVDALDAAHVVDNDVTEAFAPRHGDPWPSLVVVADHRWPLPRALRDRVNDVVSSGDVDVFRVSGADNDNVAASLAGAHVSVVEGGDVGADAAIVVDCAWSAAARRHVCGGLPEWMHVGEDTLTISGKQERCIWSHPRTDATLVIDYGRVDVKDRVHLDVALADAAADNASGAAVHASVFVDGAEASVDVHHDQGFHGADVVVGGAKRSAHVRLEFTTEHDGQRHTCYRLSTGATAP